MTTPRKKKSVIGERQAVAVELNREIDGMQLEIIDEASLDQPVGGIPTGSFGLDLAFGTGGVAKDRITEIVGPTSGGKSTLGLNILANAQQMGLRCAYLEPENHFIPAYGRRMGVDLSALLYSSCQEAEKIFDTMAWLIGHKKVEFILLDSLASIEMKDVLSGKAQPDNRRLGLLVAQRFKILNGMLEGGGTTIVIINQLRNGAPAWPGGPILQESAFSQVMRYYASHRADVRAKRRIKRLGVEIGAELKVKVFKNKCDAPNTLANFDLYYGQGIDGIGELMALIDQLKVLPELKEQLGMANKDELRTALSKDEAAVLAVQERLTAAYRDRAARAMSMRNNDRSGKDEDDDQDNDDC